MSNRVGGVNPNDPKGPDVRSEENRRIEKVEKVRSVDETENEQRARKKFRSLMDEEDSASTGKRAPTPFETQFYANQEPPPLNEIIAPDTSFDDLGDEVVASPSYSPSPDVTIPPEAEEDEAPPLPRNHNFWQQVDSSSKKSEKSPNYREIHHGQTREQKKKIAEKERNEKILATPHSKEKESIYGPPGKKGEAIHEKEKHPQSAKDEKKEIVASPTPFLHGQSKKIKENEKENVHPSKKEKEDHFLPSIHRNVETHFQKEKEENSSSKPIEIEPPTTTTLPASVIPLAQAAATEASPYLSSQIAPLFFQMVGTIYVMTTTPGISRTEIVLNAPSFANSKFFGATISIEKYATAPDSLNIRLTGSNEAVKTFNDNMTNLYAAFQNGSFNFRIGRISAEYSTEKPLIRRKEEGEDGGKGFSDRRKR